MATKSRARAATEVGTLPKALQLMITLGDFPEGARFTDVARATGLPVSTTHRVLATLVEHGFVDFNPERRLYSLGLRIFELSHKIAGVNTIAGTALPTMRKLAESTGYMVSLNILDEYEVLVLERAELPSKGVQLRARIGAREPLYSTATGKVLLANVPAPERAEILVRLELKKLTEHTITSRKELEKELQKTAMQGYGTTDEENEIGFRSIAVLVPSARSRHPIALALAAPAFLSSARMLKAQLPQLRAAAAEIGSRLVGY